ncbi:hypothetical protein Bbelb_190840, partial [Branchiostoma belcheri]
MYHLEDEGSQPTCHDLEETSNARHTIFEINTSKWRSRNRGRPTDAEDHITRLMSPKTSSSQTPQTTLLLEPYYLVLISGGLLVAAFQREEENCTYAVTTALLYARHKDVWAVVELMLCSTWLTLVLYNQTGCRQSILVSLDD